MLFAHGETVNCTETEGCLQFERKRIFNDFAASQCCAFSRAVFDSCYGHKHAKCTREAGSELSAGHSVYLQTEQLDSGLDWHLASLASGHRSACVQNRDRVR